MAQNKGCHFLRYCILDINFEFMPDNPRIPGHPSDIPSSRSSGDASITPHQSAPYTPPPAPPQHSSGKNNNSRTIIFGSLVTVLTSTLIYYLTVFQNKPKTGAADFYKIKESTINGWKQYVTIDNIYYKNILTISADTSFSLKPVSFKREIMKESGIFKKDVEAITKNELIDASLKAMVNRRVARQNEFEGILIEFCDKLENLLKTNYDSLERVKRMTPILKKYFADSKRMFDKGIQELEDNCKTLSQTYGQDFNPNDLLMYVDYKKTYVGYDISNASDNTSTTLTSQERKMLPGTWKDGNNILTLNENGAMQFSIATGDQATGTWTIDGDILKLDATSTITKAKTIFLFKLSDIKKNSFTMSRTSAPFDSYHPTRQPGK